MRRWTFLVVLAALGCGDEGNDHEDDGGEGLYTPLLWIDPSGGGGSSGGGSSGGGGAPPPPTTTTAPGGGGAPPPPPPGGGMVSTGTPPAVWDADMPASTTYHSPTVVSGQPYWQLVEARFYPPDVSATVGGDHHIMFKALDFNGTALEGQSGIATFFDNTAVAQTKGAVDQYLGNVPMFGTNWCTNDINSSPGPYSFQMAQGGLPSTRVDGMGMHCNHHTTWLLIFQKTLAP
jgi:hypothetical protein